MKRKIIIGVVLLIVVAGSIAAWKYFEKTDDLAGKEPDVKVSAQQLIAAYRTDTASANKTYTNKIVQVTGMISKVDSSAVELGEEGSMSTVAIGLDNRHLADLKELKIGSTVTFQGECTGASSADDLLSDLGVTVQIKAAGVINKK